MRVENQRIGAQNRSKAVKAIALDTPASGDYVAKLPIPRSPDMTRLAIGLAAVVSASLCCGCASDGSWSMSKMLGWDDTPSTRPAKMPKADLATAERVET